MAPKANTNFTCSSTSQSSAQDASPRTCPSRYVFDCDKWDDLSFRHVAARHERRGGRRLSTLGTTTATHASLGSHVLSRLVGTVELCSSAQARYVLHAPSCISGIESYLGEWLLDPRLVNKKLDVRISGTTNPIWRKGRYKNKPGFIVLRISLKSVDDSITVMMGYTQGQVSFRAYHLSPEITMEQEGPDSRTAHPALPMISVLGTRVVIIGADVMGTSSYIGQYALIIYTPYTLGLGEVCIQITNGQRDAGFIGYFNQTSLCRSLSLDM